MTETTAPTYTTVVPDLPSRDERMEAGKAARATVPRSAHAEWSPPAGRPDPLATLRAQDEARVRELVPIRYGRMSASPWTFLRGSAAVMATDLATGPRTDLDVQLCGDAHLSNFGLFASPDRRTLFDINDFDETHHGPFEWDLKRLATSAVVAGRANGHKRRETEAAAQASVAAYRTAIRGLAAANTLDTWYYRVEFDTVIERLRGRASGRAARTASKGAERRTSLQAFKKLTAVVDGRPRIVADPPLVVPIPDDATEETIEVLRQLFDTYRASLSPASAHLLRRFRAADVARKVVGVGSVGTEAFMVLFLGGDGEPLFLQVKEATTSVLAPHVADPYEGNQGQRVVDGQRLIQGSSDVMLGWTTLRHDDRAMDFYVRQLRDRKGSFEVETLSPEGLREYAGLCGVVLARAHARSGDAAAIAGYLGRGDRFDRAIAQWALAYADQTEADYAAMIAAIEDGSVPCQREADR